MARTISICISPLEELLQLKKQRWLQLFLTLKLQRCEACGAEAALVLESHQLCYHGGCKSKGTWHRGSKALKTSPYAISVLSPPLLTSSGSSAD